MSESESTDEKILNYLLKNPVAGDTLEGVARWWLEGEVVDYAVDTVSEALDSLVKKGVVEKVPAGEKNNSIYRICRIIKRDI